MKKLLTTLALTLGLLFGGVAFVPAAQADTAPACTDDKPCPEPCVDTEPCVEPCVDTQPCGDDRVTTPPAATCAVDQTANDYRVQVVALTAKADRLQRVADRRAATIQRLRAKIRALR